MTSITTSTITAAHPTFPSVSFLGSLWRSFVQAAARSTAAGPEELSPELRYDVGLSDQAPGRCRPVGDGF